MNSPKNTNINTRFLPEGDEIVNETIELLLDITKKA
jgi:hypothetical protein